jgi:hypothetical protein
MPIDLKLGQPLFVTLTIATAIALRMMAVMTGRTIAQNNDKASSLVVRVASFSPDQGTLRDRRDFIEGHLFPTLRTVPGYVGTFLGLDPRSGQSISLSFWRSEQAAVAGEAAVRRVIDSLPPGSAPRPSNVVKYFVEYRDLEGMFVK